MSHPNCDRDCGTRGNLAHSCLSKASLTFSGGFPEAVGLGFGTIQVHALHPQAAKVLFSSQTSSLAILFVGKPTVQPPSWRDVQYYSVLVSAQGKPCTQRSPRHAGKIIGANSITIDERFCRGDFAAPKSQASNATIAVNRSVIERIHRLKLLTVNVRAGLATRKYRVVKRDLPEALVFQSVRDGKPLRDNNILCRFIKPPAERSRCRG